MYELELQVKELNPNCELVGIKTDCLVFNNVTTDPPTSSAWGGIKKCDVPLIKQCTVNAACGQQNIRTHMYELTHETWHTVEPDNIEQHVDT